MKINLNCDGILDLDLNCPQERVAFKLLWKLNLNCDGIIDLNLNCPQERVAFKLLWKFKFKSIFI